MSVTISASLVKELRDRTGAGMMDCKRALEETGGDLEAARTLLRERGKASASKRAGRATTEGLVGFLGLRAHDPATETRAKRTMDEPPSASAWPTVFAGSWIQAWSARTPPGVAA